MASVKVAKAAEVPPGQGRVVQAGTKSLALFNVDGAYHVIDNTCPHRGGPIGDGDLEGRVAICPWHGWRYDVSTGANAMNPSITVACYPVTVEGTAVFVDL